VVILSLTGLPQHLPSIRGEHVMKSPVILIGVVLIVLGVIALAYQGITYTTHEKVLEVGPLKATAEKKHTVPLPPVLGGLTLAAGVVLVIAGSWR
jgi:hypothetical protein